VAPICNTITSLPRTVLNRANGKTAVACCNAAGTPRFASTTFRDPTQAAHVSATPPSPNECNDVYVLPHADPSQWPASCKTALIHFVNSGGRPYQACHPVGDTMPPSGGAMRAPPPTSCSRPALPTRGNSRPPHCSRCTHELEFLFQEPPPPVLAARSVLP